MEDESKTIFKGKVGSTMLELTRTRLITKKNDYNIDEIEGVQQIKMKMFKEVLKNIGLIICLPIAIFITLIVCVQYSADEDTYAALCGLLSILFFILIIYRGVKINNSRYRLYLKIKGREQPILIAYSKDNIDAVCDLIQREVASITAPR